MTEPNDGRRRFLGYVGAAAATALAGCGGGPTPTPSPGGDQIPQQYRTATSQGGQRRNPDGLSTKEAVQYQDEPNGGNQCSGCTFYIPDKNGDGLGACAIVEGTIAPDAWCASYSPHEGE